MSTARSDQDLLAEYMKAGETGNAARFLRFLTEKDRGTVRRYPNPRSKSKGKSGDWQITRSLAQRAFEAESLDDFPLLLIHLRSSFESYDGDTRESRKQRAIENFEACLDAIRNIDSTETANFFALVDAAADYAIGMIEAGKFPSHQNVLNAAAKLTKCKVTSTTEGTRILAAARLSFLPWEKPKRGTTEHSMKAGFKKRIR